jgi:uncharacterized protein (TIGR03382 family)
VAPFVTSDTTLTFVLAVADASGAASSATMRVTVRPAAATAAAADSASGGCASSGPGDVGLTSLSLLAMVGWRFRRRDARDREPGR